MASPKSGSGGSAVSLTGPAQAAEATDAATAQVSEVAAEGSQREPGSLRHENVEPYTPPATPEEKATKSSWIEIELVDKFDKPIAGASYKIETSDGKLAFGTLNARGFARLDGIEPGNCRVTFPDYSPTSWKRV